MRHKNKIKQAKNPTPIPQKEIKTKNNQPKTKQNKQIKDIHTSPQKEHNQIQRQKSLFCFQQSKLQGTALTAHKGVFTLR